MNEKTRIDVKMFWYTHILVLPKFVSIVTTIDKEGKINAAPYSLGTPYISGKRIHRYSLECVSPATPVGMLLQQGSLL